MTPSKPFWPDCGGQPDKDSPVCARIIIRLLPPLHFPPVLVFDAPMHAVAPVRVGVGARAPVDVVGARDFFAPARVSAAPPPSSLFEPFFFFLQGEALPFLFEGLLFF